VSATSGRHSRVQSSKTVRMRSLIEYDERAVGVLFGALAKKTPADIGPYFTVDISTFAWYKAGVRGGVK
jgi:hypothetical protein